MRSIPKSASRRSNCSNASGVDVDYPQEQTCCGQPMANSGAQNEAAGAERVFARNFADYDYIVGPSASCIHHVREHLTAIEQTAAVRKVRASAYELVEFLHDVLKVRGVSVGRISASRGLAQQLQRDPASEARCRHRKSAGTPFSKPRALLEGVKGIEFVTPARPDECCGFGGTFSVTEEAVSVRMGQDKVRDHLGAGAQYIVSGDMSCLMHQQGCAERMKARRALHPYRAGSERSTRMSKRDRSRESGGRVHREDGSRRVSRQAPVGPAQQARCAGARHRRNGRRCAIWRRGSRNTRCRISPTTSNSSSTQAEANGVVVHCAATAEEHNAIVHKLMSERGMTTLVKSKSMLTDECKMREYLEPRGITVMETDLGERIQQLDHQDPSHMVVPAVHKLRADVAELFGRTIGTDPKNSDIHYLAESQRMNTRPYFVREKTAGMTGCNFAVAETGTVVVCTNEGNADLSANVPPLHIASIGIEKLIPKMSDLGVFMRMLSRSALGSPITQYTSHFRAPRPGTEMHYILVDHGRSERLAMEDFWYSLKCIRCGACMNTCPVYRRSGGLSYGGTYSGPIGAIINPTFDLKRYSACRSRRRSTAVARTCVR